MLDSNDHILQYQPLWQHWTVESFIGEGGNGRVYSVARRDRGGEYHSAVKLISIPKTRLDIQQARQMGMDEQEVYRYFDGMVSQIVREIKIMYTLRAEPNIVSYEDHAIFHKEHETRWDVLIRMELLTSLYDYQQKHPLSADEVARLGLEICSALEACQKKNILHRDIKESNIFVTNQGSFKLGDFGVAREIIQSSWSLSMRGTPAYIAPEVHTGQKYDARADIYSLGILLYKCLNDGRNPFMPPA